MARLIPGRIRNQGIELYEQGLVKIIDDRTDLLRAEVDTYQVQYGINDEDIRCQCDYFERKQYCQHIAALEYFLKNNQKGKSLSEQLNSQLESKEETKKLTSFGSLFLDSLHMNEDDTTKYRLLAFGAKSPFSSDYWWSLKINRLPGEKAYVIRDIKAFIHLVKIEGYYQIGKNYFESLSILQFDQASQDLIRFLWRLSTHSDKLDYEWLFPNHARHLRLPTGFFEEGIDLLTGLYEFSFESSSHTYSHLYVRPLEAEAGLFQFTVDVHRSSIELYIKEKNIEYFFNNEYLLYMNTFYHLSLKQQKMVQAIRSLPIEADLAKHIHFDLDDQAKLAASLLEFRELGQVKAPKSFDIRDFQVTFVFDITEKGELTSQLIFDYGSIQISDKASLDQLPFASHYKKENRIYRALKRFGLSPQFFAKKALTDPKDWYRFFTEAVPYFESLGRVQLSSKLQDQRLLESPQLTVKREGGLLDISFDFSTVCQTDIEKALATLFSDRSYFVNQSGKLVVFDEETQKISRSLQELRAKQLANGHLQLEGIAATQLSHLFSDLSSVHFSEELETLIKDLQHPERFELGELGVKAKVRDYQLQGIKWLSVLDKYGFGGILADDMGLGKTLQIIAFLSSRLTETSKVLILAPSSLIYNWLDEFSKFAPQIDAAVSYGLKPARDALIQEGHQVTITSYSSFRQDLETYQANDYDYLILDEAQMIKNAQTKIAQSLRAFDVKNCFALSGTPIENKLLEIWSIFQIVLPGLLPSKKAFLKMEARDVSRYIKPFVMRRKKEEVLPELPELIEMNYYNEMSDGQKAIYLAQLRQMQERLSAATDDDINRSKLEILSGITRLRQICDTPSLFMDYQGGSGKLDNLRTLLLQIKENGHRALLFSQFKGMLALVKQEMDQLGLSSYTITGSTPANDRQEMTRAFNNGSKDAFLISLKAGGVGLNLTGADTVILIDLWWNPAVEMQAISRAHRIGQEDNVEVYRLITRGTIEEKMLELQENKRHLITTVLDGNQGLASMSVEEIKEILGLQP
ncbi:TPA: DEAD/DEAH box helicase [Streptococcus equi subsp. zooepidemicus]|uniref:DEAD/DEAH box helicase n=1 Tax=Streptococcus equi TaxID=1336 RepID=UPI001E2B36C7|nr:DEAD/DEAH box helicase [Streptococcus equi]MCD3461167.1 DEAD/DEAH box helicase [Streptococcus equi subsp. zooepidemicus]HEK9980457.1 DEAD/DEAH box helicase [Streptococcus equi subsp. zooepidemicus]HEL0766140.1 DEAD/DEAH box helicase [Streptococcus equi subsp. zooepidemicus]HEL0789565.1 DEAD/DEAH box helicase [Streptococcus equi subsp. zooepidemicus]HEL1130449.1 DEAD/DEAH box helicase [Streptococcus equi subsp. zooepidemicus]